MKKKICFVVSAFVTAQSFLKDHIIELSKEFDVFLVANFEDQDMERLKLLELAGFKRIGINRKVNISEDLKALYELTSYLKSQDFFAVHSVTPKAGLLTAIAAKRAGIKNRIHIFTGQVWVTKTGLFKKVLMGLDKFIANRSTKVLVDGQSQKEFLIANGIIDDSAMVLGKGSISGVDTEKFTSKPEIRQKIREEIGVADDHTVFIFLGRINVDKGINELLSAFEKLNSENPKTFLLMVGFDEENFKSKIHQNPMFVDRKNYFFYGSTLQPANLLNAADVFCLPSYREGFGSSVIEASSVGLPVIASDAYGLRDAYVENVTGLKCKVGDVETLYAAMKKLSDNSELRTELGENGKKRAKEFFDKKYVCGEWLKFYQTLS